MTDGERSKLMRRTILRRRTVMLCIAAAMLIAPSTSGAVSQSPPKSVIGSGTINIPMLPVRSRPIVEDIEEAATF